jgi:uncharacterized phage protein (TIGR01671 family)
MSGTPRTLHYIYDAEPTVNTDNLIWLGWTGLTDKNGVEVFEGDIVTWTRGATNELEAGAVEWDKEYAGFGITDDHCLDWCQAIEVIGNIYEDKNLLDDNSGL